MIFLTGATGFVGQNLIRKLAKKDKVKCLVRNESKAEQLKKEGYETLVGDISKYVPPEELDGAEVVVHAAASLRGKGKEWWEVNVKGTENLVNACKKAGVKQIIYLSSIMAHEKYDGEYSVSKRAGEEEIKKAGIDYVILRIGNIYSKNNTRSFGNLLNAVRKIPVIIVVRNVKAHYVSLEDVNNAIVAAMKNPEVKDKTYYLVGEALLFKDFFRLIAKKLGKKRIIISVPAFPVKITLSIYNKIIGNFIKPIRMRTFLINNEFDSGDAERDLRFHKSTAENLADAVE